MEGTLASLVLVYHPKLSVAYRPAPRLGDVPRSSFPVQLPTFRCCWRYLVSINNNRTKTTRFRHSPPHTASPAVGVRGRGDPSLRFGVPAWPWAAQPTEGSRPLRRSPER